VVNTIATHITKEITKHLRLNRLCLQQTRTLPSMTERKQNIAYFGTFSRRLAFRLPELCNFVPRNKTFCQEKY
jgi:hypothetical protein